MDKETADAVRGIARRVTIRKINDDGEMQTASVEVADGLVREDVEVLQAFGQVSHSAEDGGLAIALALGCDQGDIVILPIGNPSTRMGKSPKGTVGHANASGDRILIYPDGRIEASAAASILAKVGDVSLTLSPGSIVATVGGATITVTGGRVDIDGAELYNNGIYVGTSHGHVSAPPGPPGPPVG